MKNISLICLFMASATLSWPQMALSLEQAIEIGIANSIGAKIAQIDQEIAANNNTWKAAGRHPSITANLNNQNALIIQDNPTSFLGKATILGNSINGNVDVAINLYDGGRIQVNKRLLEQQVDVTDNAFKQTIEQTIKSIIQSYYQAQIVKEQLGTYDEILELSNDRIAYENVKKEYGQAGTFDLLQTQDALLNDSTSYLMTVNNYDNAILALKLAMGELDNAQQYDVSDPIAASPIAFNVQDVINKVIANNSQLDALELSRALATTQIDLQKVALKPTLTLNSGLNASLTGNDLYGDSDFARQVNYTLGNSISPYVNLTARFLLYDGGNIKRQVKNAELDVQRVGLQIEDQQRTLKTQVLNALANYRHQLELMKITDSRIQNAKRNLEIAEERFKAAQITSFDYRTIQLSYINANLSRLNVLYNLKLSELEIDALTGDLIAYQ